MNNISKTYKASISKAQGNRQSYVIIFRHPVRKDRNTGKPGLRVRAGLGTRDEGEAIKLVEQMNELLSNPDCWTLASKTAAKDRFDSRIVDIFYYKLVPQPTNFMSERNQVIPLPSSSDSEYRSVLLLGTTGAGKTTLLRQIIGTDPIKERFPSTSTSKTTVADMEIIISDGDYHAVVTFMEKDEVRDYLEGCIFKSVLLAYQRKSDSVILRGLLQHVDQRMRFNYILGNGPIDEDDDYEEEFDDESELDKDEVLPETSLKFDLEKTNELLDRAVTRIKKIANKQGEQLKIELNADGESDQRVVEELFEEEFDRLLRQDEECHSIADELMDEIEIRFKGLTQGTIRKTKQGWPVFWEFSSNERNTFIKEILRFSSNYAPSFGTLLTPLVNGIRIKGPFSPSWNETKKQPLVIIDGEGLGHTPDSSSSLSTKVIRQMGEVDAVILVDNAAQPLQAAPVAALRSLIQTGNIRKLLMCFTHFDGVQGDNLPNIKAKKEHVLASVENVVISLGDDLGPNAERTLRARLDSNCYFLGGIDRILNPAKKIGQQSIVQLKELLLAVDKIVEQPELSEARPVYDRTNLVLAIRKAAGQFQEVWLSRLGRKDKPGIDKEHWTRIKALNRRLAKGWAEGEYDNLKPVADLHKQLGKLIYVTIQNPIRWEGSKPNEDGQQQIFDEFSSALSNELLELASRRVWVERSEQWQEAYSQSGRGSTFVRAEIIEGIYRTAAPVPDLTPSPDRNKFLHEVLGLVESICKELNIKLE